jgi:hypothetical protein
VQLGLSAADIGAVWRPAAFSFWTDLHGPIGAPVPLPWTDNATGSGNATVDAAMQKFLATAGLSARLRPDHYRVIIGP